jgi:hypothetical protein
MLWTDISKTRLRAPGWRYQNPRSTIALRFLAGSLARLGHMERAANVLQDMLKIEPQLTLAKLRSRLVGIDEGVWSKVADGLRLAGLPD